MKRIISTAICLLLLACGGGGGGDESATVIVPETPPVNAPKSIAGIWSGSFVSDVLHRVYEVTGIVTETGDARFLNLTWGAQYGGVVNTSGSSFSAITTAYAPFGSIFPNGSHTGPVSVTGNFSPRATLTGTYAGVGDSGSFALTYNPLYERPSSLGLVAGIWKGTVLGFLNTVIVNDSGALSGGSASGCVYAGSMAIIDVRYNAYTVNIAISSCGAQNGLYSGLGVLVDAATANDTFLVSISNGSYSFVASLRRT